MLLILKKYATYISKYNYYPNFVSIICVYLLIKIMNVF